MPEAITTIQSTLPKLAKISDVLEKEGQQVLQRSDLFPTLNKKVIPTLNSDEDAPVPNEMRLRHHDQEESSSNEMEEDFTPITFHGYVMRGGSIDCIVWQVLPTIKKIVKNLYKCLGKCFENLVSDPMFTAVATILDIGAMLGNWLTPFTRQQRPLRRDSSPYWRRVPSILIF